MYSSLLILLCYKYCDVYSKNETRREGIKLIYFSDLMIPYHVRLSDRAVIS